MTKIQLVFCDDDPGDLKIFRESADDYINQRGLFGETFCFSSPEEVLMFSENGGDENIVTVYLFDVIMRGMDGIELGRKIRERDRSSAIIYISTSREYSLDAFSVRAFSYIIKPFSPEKLFSELDECLSLTDSAPRTFPIKAVDGTVYLELSEIIAVEYLNHRLIFHMADRTKIESAYRREPFDVQAVELMQTGFFLKVSASYLVNYRNIQGVKSDEFVMSNGSQYKITRKYASVRQRYINGEMTSK